MSIRKMRAEFLLLALLCSLEVALAPRFVSAQAPARGTIAGTVSADQGPVRGFRVTAHNVRSMI